MYKKNHLSSLPFFSVLGLILIMFSSCNNQDSVQITFAAGPDETETIQYLVDKFNTENKGTIQVNWRQTARSTNENFEEIQTDFDATNPEIDVFASDVIWTGVLGAQASVEDLSKQFYNSYNPRDFVQAAMNSATYNFSIYGVPWFTDAAMIYYRKDLLTKYGFTKPPVTWTELQTMAKTVMAQENLPYGYVFQGDKYEGGVANACEFIWNAGGQITMDNLSISTDFGAEQFEPSIITIDSKASEDGFRVARQLIEQGISPEAVVNYQELEATNAFLLGKSVFMRGWPGVYGQLLKNKASINAEQVGVSPIPVLKVGTPSYSCLGGWNLMIAAHASAAKKEAAWKFIQYLTAAPQQRTRALRSGTLPTLKALYEEEQLLAKVPVMNFAKQEIQNARSRPVSAHYMKYSPEIAIIFNQMLKGEILPEYAVFALQEYLEDIRLNHTVANH